MHAYMHGGGGGNELVENAVDLRVVDSMSFAF
jgi:hypothetical protein